MNEFLQAFDDLKIANIDAGDLKLIFGIYETNFRIQYSVFLQELFEKLPANREVLVAEAFERVQGLDLEQLKNSFDPSRHPDVLKGTKTIDEAKFEFCNLFTSLHSANKWFRNETCVSYEDFLEWHTIVNT